MNCRRPNGRCRASRARQRDHGQRDGEEGPQAVRLSIGIAAGKARCRAFGTTDIHLGARAALNGTRAMGTGTAVSCSLATMRSGRGATRETSSRGRSCRTSAHQPGSSLRPRTCSWSLRGTGPIVHRAVPSAVDWLPDRCVRGKAAPPAQGVCGQSEAVSTGGDDRGYRARETPTIRSSPLVAREWPSASGFRSFRSRRQRPRMRALGPS